MQKLGAKATKYTAKCGCLEKPLHRSCMESSRGSQLPTQAAASFPSIYLLLSRPNHRQQLYDRNQIRLNSPCLNFTRALDRRPKYTDSEKCEFSKVSKQCLVDERHAL